MAECHAVNVEVKGSNPLGYAILGISYNGHYTRLSTERQGFNSPYPRQLNKYVGMGQSGQPTPFGREMPLVRIQLPAPYY